MNALQPVGALPDEIITWAEAAYSKQNLPSIFRVTGLLDEAIDRKLGDAGYVAEGDSRTLYADLPAMPMRRDPDVTIADRPDAAWFKAMAARRVGTHRSSTIIAPLCRALQVRPRSSVSISMVRPPPWRSSSSHDAPPRVSNPW